MKKFTIVILIAACILSGCGSNSSNTGASPEIEATENVEEVATPSDLSEMDAAVNDFPEEVSQYINDYISVDLDGTFTVSVEINDAGHMGLVADYITKAVDGLSEKYSGYDILITYKDEAGWVCTWHSYDNQVGILINTLTNYTEQNVTVDRLYEWNNQ